MHRSVGFAVMVSWCLWVAIFLSRHKEPGRTRVHYRKEWRLGILLQGAAFAVLFWSPQVSRATWRLVPALFLTVLSVFLVRSAMTHLGRQWALAAGTYDEHELVTTGPYAHVRNPIYLAVFMLIAGTGLYLAPTPQLIAALALCAAGTEVRIRAEERALAERFGPAFDAYRNRVPAWLPGVR